MRRQIEKLWRIGRESSKRSKQIALLSVSLATMKCIYSQYSTISCQNINNNVVSDSINHISQDQLKTVDEQLKQQQEDEQQQSQVEEQKKEEEQQKQEEEINEQQQDQEEEIEEEEDGIIRIRKYQDISDMIIHHTTQTQCLVFMPNCSKQTKSIILKSIQEKRRKESIKIFSFSPKLVVPNSKLEKKEQEKEKLLQDKLKGVEFFAVNSFGDLRFFSLNDDNNNNNNNSQNQNQTQKKKNEPLSIKFTRMMNFFSPPALITEREYPQLIQNIQDLPEEERIILSYIPEEKVYHANLPKFNQFDFYRQDRIQNINDLERRFRDISYDYVDKNTKFIIIRDQDVAASLSIGKEDAGQIYILKRTQKSMNHESNWFFHGKEYIYNKIEWDPNNDTKIQLNENEIIQKLYQKSFNYVNQINTEQDLNNFLSNSNEMGVKKILIYYSADVLEQDYESKITNKLISVKKNIPDQDFVILFTKNPQLLKKVFRIIPDKYTDTIRLLDYSNHKNNNKNNQNNKYQDWVSTVFYSLNPLSPQTTTQQITKEQQIAQSQTVYSEDSDDALRYKYDGKITRNKLTYFIKQSLQSNHSCQKNSSRYLNAANFNREILQNESDDICIVYFYKPGCPNCFAMNKAVEKFIKDLEIINTEVNKYESGQAEYKAYDDNLINQYRLENFSKFKNIKIYKYNIYNECKEFPSPSASPLVFFFGKDNRFKPIQADMLKDRVNINDAEKVSRYLFKKIDLLNI